MCGMFLSMTHRRDCNLLHHVYFHAITSHPTDGNGHTAVWNICGVPL